MTFAEEYRDELVEQLEEDIGQGVFEKRDIKGIKKLINWIKNFEEEGE